MKDDDDGMMAKPPQLSRLPPLKFNGKLGVRKNSEVELFNYVDHSNELVEKGGSRIPLTKICKESSNRNKTEDLDEQDNDNSYDKNQDVYGRFQISPTKSIISNDSNHSSRTYTVKDDNTMTISRFHFESNNEREEEQLKISKNNKDSNFSRNDLDINSSNFKGREIDSIALGASPNLHVTGKELSIENSDTNIEMKHDYRKIAIDLATGPKVIKEPNKRTKRYCDFVLVFNAASDDVYSINERELFESALQRDGLEVVKTVLGANVFVELYATFDRLCKEAENIFLQMPLKGTKLEPNVGRFNRFFKSMKTDDEVDMISAPFCSSSKNIFNGIDNPRTFFRSGLRSMLVRHILETTKITLSQDTSESKVYKTGISALLHSGSYNNAFILHERSEYDKVFPIRKGANASYLRVEYADSRKDLHNTWLKCTKMQPLWKIRNYYGEKIALYFAWLGILIASLLIPAFLGIAVCLYGFISTYSSGETFKTEVKLWIAKSLDNDTTPFFALIICIWGTVFLELWKRKNAELAYKWDVDSFEEQEPNRPQFFGTKLVRDPISGVPEPYYPTWRKVLKSMGSYGLVLFMVVLVVSSVVSVVVYKVVSRVDWFSTITAGSFLSSLTSSILNSLSILILGKLYRLLAYKLTDWENHRTRTQYEDSLTMKLFGFQFVNSYCSLFYIAFFREMTATGIFHLGSSYTDSCGENNDCMSELTLQVAVMMIMKPMPKLLSDIIIPFIKKHIRSCRSCCKKKSKVSSYDEMKTFFDPDREYERYIEEEYKKPSLGDFTLSEYTEKVLQYGYLMLFASAFPLAPLIALLTNVIDLRVDARRMLWFNQRPVPLRAQDIGIWFTILYFLNFTGMITNAFIIGVTSRFGRKYHHRTYSFDANCTLLSMSHTTPSNVSSTSSLLSLRTSDNVWIILIFENVVLAIKFFLEYVIPDVSESVNKAKAQEKLHLEKLLSQSGLRCGPGKTIRNNSPTISKDSHRNAQTKSDLKKRERKVRKHDKSSLKHLVGSEEDDVSYPVL